MIIKFPGEALPVSFALRSSKHHQVARWPQMLLPATYNGVQALVLLGMSATDLSSYYFQELIQSYQGQSGYFIFPHVNYAYDICKESKANDTAYACEYFNFHLTNYALGALELLESKPRFQLSFLKNYGSESLLDAWWQRRYWQDPWAEGNLIVNLASFYHYQSKSEKTFANLLHRLLLLNKETVDPRSGYWTSWFAELGATELEQGMAGAAHNFHIYYYFNQAIPYYEKIIDHGLEYLKGGCRSACLDVDICDVLVNMYCYGYRRDDILQLSQKMLQQLLALQNDDGGFPDMQKGIRRFDSWVCGYWEAQGSSNVFATWFRLIAIAMLSTLHEFDGSWQFRNTLGIGYYKKDYHP